MSEEIKEEKSKAGVATAVVVAIAVIVGGIMLFKSSNNAKVQEQKVAIATTAPKPKAEKTVARIDLTTKLVDANKPQFVVYIDGSEIPQKQAEWMPKLDKQGYVVQKNGKEVTFLIKSINDTKINVELRGRDFRDENNKFVPVWVNYKSVSINGEEILHKAVEAWHSKPFIHTITAKSGDEYKIHIEWQKSNK